MTNFIVSQLFVRLPYPTGSYVGKTIVITGANTGLGKEAARHYARLGASRIIIGVRNLEKGKAAKQDIQSTPNCGKSQIEVWSLDMCSYASVKAFASRVMHELDRVDIFHCNAGVAKMQYYVAEDNEEQITVNVVSTVLLAALVAPKLRETAAKYQTRPFLGMTSSGAHAFSKFEQRNAPEGQIFTTINDKQKAEKNFNDQYPLSKLLTIVAVRGLAAEAPASKVPFTIALIDPGLCHSELSRDFDSLTFRIMKFLLARSTEKGSRTLVNGGDFGAEAHGKYIADCKIDEPAPVVTNNPAAEGRVWSELKAKLEAIEPGVTRNLLG